MRSGRFRSHTPWLVVALGATLGAGVRPLADTAHALGESTRLEVVGIDTGGKEPRPTARRRLAWELRKRTSVQPRLSAGRVRLDDPSIFQKPFLYWSGAGAFASRSDAEIIGLRRFVELGGFLFIDDAEPDDSGFDSSITQALERAFPGRRLEELPTDHTLFHSFYLIDRPVGRVEGPARLRGLRIGDRVAVVYSRHDIAGAIERDDLGTYLHAVVPGGAMQRETAIRLAVNIVLYALCLDYKDDQVHAPFIMRRRGRAP